MESDKTSCGWTSVSRWIHFETARNWTQGGANLVYRFVTGNITLHMGNITPHMGNFTLDMSNVTLHLHNPRVTKRCFWNVAHTVFPTSLSPFVIFLKSIHSVGGLIT